MNRARTIRSLILLLAVVAFLTVSVAAALPAHWHSGAPTGGCDLCAVAHFPAFAAPLPLAMGLPAPESAHREAASYHSLSEGFDQPNCSRGPPC